MNFTLIKKLFIMFFIFILVLNFVPNKAIENITTKIVYQIIESQPQATNGGGGEAEEVTGGEEVTESETCQENWQCEDWSQCSPQNKTTRTCIDINNCGTTTLKPQTEDVCIYVEENIIDEEIQSTIEKPQYSFFSISNLYYLIFLMLIILIIIIFIIIKIKGRGKKNKEIPMVKEIPIVELPELPEIDYTTQLTNYVKKALKEGYTEENIRKNLKENSWPENILNKAIEKAKSELKKEETEEKL